MRGFMWDMLSKKDLFINIIMHYTSSKVYNYISKQTQDPIVERKTCEISWQEFPIFQSDLEFYSKISPVFDWKKYQIPTPKLCPEERARRRMTYKNDRTLYKNICSGTWNSIISIYNPQNNFKIYNIKDWRSDKRDPLRYGFDYDETESFFSQFNKLNNSVPKIAMVNDNWISSENCEYCQNVAYSKNCYLTTVSWKLEDSHYNSNMAWGKSLLDCFFTMDSENSYECTDSYNLFWCFWLSDSRNSTNCLFGHDLIWCSNCLCSTGLRNKQYCIWNKQYSKQEYELKEKEIKNKILYNLDEIKSKFKTFSINHFKKSTNLFSSENSFWNNLVNASNSILCYNIKNLQDCKYSIFGDTIKDSYDLTVWWELELCYEWIVPDHSHSSFFTIFSRSCQKILYSEMCHNCSNCFWCVWLKNKEYCILNKQYTKTEYEKLVPKIIKIMTRFWERWEFFPTKYSPFNYNETIAQDYFPINKTQVKKYNTQRLETKKEINISDNIKFIDPSTLSPNPNEVDSDIINKAIICNKSNRPFRIIENELKFYRNHNIPIPHKHPDIRILDRLAQMPQKALHFRNCSKCKKEIISVYSTENYPSNILCENCYKEEIY